MKAWKVLAEIDASDFGLLMAHTQGFVPSSFCPEASVVRIKPSYCRTNSFIVCLFKFQYKYNVYKGASVGFIS